MTRQGGFGAELGIGTPAVAIMHIEEYEFPEFEKILKEVTAHSSPGGYAEWLATGKRQLNEFELTVTWDRDQATHEAILAAFDSEDPVQLTASDPDSREEIAFMAHVHKLGRTTDQEDAYQCKVGIQPTGQPTLSYASV
jgi:hypothetical protein